MPKPDKQGPYETLGIKPNATPADIKKAHRRRVKETHPDTGGEPEDFIRVQKAFALLMDRKRRADYDASGTTEDRVPGTAQSLLLGFFAKAFMQFIADETGRFDLRADIAGGLSQEILNQQGQVRLLNARLKRTRKLLGKIRRKTAGPNWMEEQVNTAFNEMTEDRDRCQVRGEDLSEALRMLGEFEFLPTEDFVSQLQGWSFSMAVPTPDQFLYKP